MQSANCKAKEKTDDAQISERTTNESIRCNIGKWSNGLCCSTKQIVENDGCSSSTVETYCNTSGMPVRCCGCLVQCLLLV
jgi:hypothetical protein